MSEWAIESSFLEGDYIVIDPLGEVRGRFSSFDEAEAELRRLQSQVADTPKEDKL